MTQRSMVHCNTGDDMAKVKPDVRAYLSQIGAKGGSQKGPTKTRSKEHYRMMARKRWNKGTVPEKLMP